MKQEIKERIEKIKKGEVPEGYKKNEIGIYPSNWTLKNFDNLFNFEGGYAIPRENLRKEGLCYLHYGDIHTNSKSYINLDKDFEKLPKIKIEHNKINKKYMLSDGDIVFVDASEDYNGIGKSVVITNNYNIPFVAGLHTIIAKDKTEFIFKDFKRFFTSSYDIRKQFMFYATGISVLGISKSNIKKIKVVLPPLQEQQKIAQILSIWDRAIELKEKLINEKKEYKKGLMQNLLSGKIRLPGFEEKWEKTNIGEVLDFVRKEPIKNPQDYYLLTVKLHVKGIEATNKKPNVTEKGRPYFLREPNELLIGRQNFHNGGIGIVPENMKGFVASNAISSMYAKKGLLKFYFYYFANENFYKKIEHIIGGTGQKEISETMIKKLKIVIPKDLKEQQAIVNILSTADKEIKLLEEELEALKQQKRGLMQLLLTGIVRVN